MKKFLLLSLAVFFVLNACTENPNEPVSTQAKDYFPLSIGNYWVYNVEDLDENGYPIGPAYIDSVVIEGKTTIEGLDAFIAVTYRNNVIAEQVYYNNSGSAIRIFTRALSPYIPADSAHCWSKIKYKWSDIITFDRQKWYLQDSVAGDEYPSLEPVVNGEDTSYNTIMSKTAWVYTKNFERKDSKIFNINGHNISGEGFNLYGKRIYRLIEPPNVQFVVDEDDDPDVYQDSNRTIVANRFDLKLWYAKNVGQVYTIGKLNNTQGIEFYRRRELIRYKV